MLDNTKATRAGFGPRLAAYLADRLILLAALALIRIPFGVAALFGAGGLTSPDFLFRYSALDVLCWLLTVVYFVLLTYFTGSTLGKKIMRLRVERSDGSPLRFIDVLYRESVGRFLSGILYLGYLMVLVDGQKRSFHDWLCGTCVVYEGVRFRPRVGKAVPDYAVPGGYSQPGESGEPAPALPEAAEAESAPPDAPAEEGLMTDAALPTEAAVDTEEVLPSGETAPKGPEPPVVGEFAAQGLREPPCS